MTWCLNRPEEINHDGAQDSELERAMTQQERTTRRTIIVRRWVAYRVGRAQREIWKRRRAFLGDAVDEGSGATDDLLAELPESLLG